MRALLVEDDEMIGGALRQALLDAALAADLVTDGATALATMASQHYDVVLLDLGLPDRDGLQILKHIRREGVDVPVIIITARDALDSRINGLDHGADDYLIKPFEVGELLERAKERVDTRTALHRPADDRAVFDSEVMGAVHVYPPVQCLAVEELNPAGIGGPLIAAGGSRRFLLLR